MWLGASLQIIASKASVSYILRGPAFARSLASALQTYDSEKNAFAAPFIRRKEIEA
jgi:hypothetical protein